MPWGPTSSTLAAVRTELLLSCQYSHYRHTTLAENSSDIYSVIDWINKTELGNPVISFHTESGKMFCRNCLIYLHENPAWYIIHIPVLEVENKVRVGGLIKTVVYTNVTGFYWEALYSLNMCKYETCPLSFLTPNPHLIT